MQNHSNSCFGDLESGDPVGSAAAVSHLVLPKLSMEILLGGGLGLVYVTVLCDLRRMIR